MFKPIFRVYPEAAVASVDCSTCGAPKGEQCRNNAVPRLHSQRLEAAEAVALEAEREAGYHDGRPSR